MDISLKQRIRDGDPVNIAFAPFDMPEGEVRKVLGAERFDLVFMDVQHWPTTEHEVVSRCRLTGELGVPALLRIKHPAQAYLAGNWADLGPLGIVIPMVEDAATAQSAIEWFYYPPIGRRSWGPVHGYRAAEFKDRGAYAQWWNENGILAVQIESVAAASVARSLALPGIDMILFGGNDLGFSIQTHPEGELRSHEACFRHVEDATAGTGVRVCSGDMPWGRF